MSASDVSVVIATWNGARYLAAAVESVLHQTRAPRELIVVDDGSTDETADIMAQYPSVRYVRRARAGQPAALNAGIAIAQGEWLAFNDSDDVWMPDKLERQLQAAAQDPALEALFGHCEQFLEADAPEAIARGLTDDRRILPAQLPAAMLIRRAAFHRVGDFSESMPIGAVVDWYARAQQAALRSLMLPDVVYQRRLHGANLGWQQRAEAPAGYLKAAREALRRRRGAAPE